MEFQFNNGLLHKRKHLTPVFKVQEFEKNILYILKTLV